MNNKVRAVLENILERFKSGDIPSTIAYATFPIPEIPSARWSFLNRFVMCLSGTSDARGFRQWHRAGRSVKKGAKAIYILVPQLVKIIDANDEDAEKIVLKGFTTQPVFRVDDTEGEPLDYEKEIPLPDLPFMERAREWGISVSAVPMSFKAYGVYRANAKEILLATSEETVFFHELSHAAYDRAVEKLKPGQLWNQEVAAELSAQVLCRLVGKKPHDTLGNSYRYIESYARESGLSSLSACLSVLDSVEKVLAVILKADTGHTENDSYEWPMKHGATTIQQEVT